ncbi:hypothetical protein C7B65_22765 [Phormidesmis priestleyi ULC007]|uniref:Uncharacterized protein n=1 Tax=Phormidesmis priestleyi ULC007 TaxID=1920490 RepID=A0A2T1D6D5_9CYAN|nr:hypothetical protein [Phormidesmis priestleyi]PSB16050.1 hypothetical protein C7B65_22765 [Phormidesmis priestleyi ULC007]PZO52246.1 MAG: hypothetical protein DCF14_07215 [Phormidesmis priestleyi]
MPLPNDYNAAEHLQDTIKRVYNGEVREWFADVIGEQLDLSTPRASLKTACTHQEADSTDMTVSRQLLFDMVIKQTFKTVSGGSERDLNYTILRKTKPILKLYFLEDHIDTDPDYRQVEGVIGVRLMGQTSTTLSKTEAIAYGNKVKTLFGTGKGFSWKKGKEMCSYSDWAKGYQLQLLVRNETEGKRIVEQVLDIQGHSPDWEFLNMSVNSEPSQAFPTIPPRETILGKSHKLSRRRPISEVFFQHASIKLAGLPKPVYIYDRSGRIPDALVHR